MPNVNRNIRDYQKMGSILTVSGREIKFLKVDDKADAELAIEVFINAIKTWQIQGYSVKIHVLELYDPDEGDNHYKYAALFIKNNILEQVYLHQNFTKHTGGYAKQAYSEFQNFLAMNSEIKVTKERYELYSKSGESIVESDKEKDESRIINYLEENDYLR